MLVAISRVTGRPARTGSSAGSRVCSASVVRRPGFEVRSAGVLILCKASRLKLLWDSKLAIALACLALGISSTQFRKPQ